MRLRRKYISEIKGNKTLQKCLALVLVLKNKLNTSRIHHYSVNKLCKTTGVSHKTAEKYERWLLEYGFIHFEGTADNRVLVINKVSSHTTNRNVSISGLDFSSFFMAYRSLQSFVFMKIQYNKDFIRHLLQARHNPDNPECFKKARRQVRNLVKNGILDSMDAQYKEYGLSLKRIAEDVGCCVRTVQRVIAFAEFNQWVERERHFEWYPASGVNHRQIDGFTFSTKDALCIVRPNTYVLSELISNSFSVGMVSL